MKRIARYTTLMLMAALSLLWSGCEEMSSDIDGAKSGNVSFVLRTQAAKVIDTRALDENVVSNVNLLIYKNGSLFSSHYLTSVQAGVAITDILVPENPYTVYVVANTNDPALFSGAQTESQLLSQYRSIQSLADLTPTTNIMMSGKVIVGTYTPQVNISLERMFAKHSITVNDNTPSVDLLGLRLVNLAARSYYISNGVNDAVSSTPSYYNTDWQALTSGVKQTYYIFENQKGTGVDKTTSIAAPTGSSYIEIGAKNTTTNSRYLYRIYLGENYTTDYNIKRNYAYDITININGISQITSDIRVTTYTGMGYIDNGLMLHYDGIWNGGLTISVNNSNLTKRDKWVNLGYAGSDYDMTLSNFTYSSSSDGWNNDCLVFPSTRLCYASTITLKDTYRPTTGTLEVVFRGSSSSSGVGYSMASIYQSDVAQPYTVFDLEYFANGLGFVAATNRNGLDYTNSNVKNGKNSATVVFDGNKCIGYFNGRQVSQEVKAYPSLPYSALSKLVVGNYSTLANPVNGFFGRIYAVRFYNRVLTPTEIQANYTNDRLRFGLSN